MEKLIKSKERVKKFAEVFTPEWVVHKMLDDLDNENGGKPGLVEDIHSTIFEPACGEGAFIRRVYERRLPYCKTNWERLIALSTLYGVEIQRDNVILAKEKLAKIAIDAYEIGAKFDSDDASYYCALVYLILSLNIIEGDFLWGKENIVFTFWKPKENYFEMERIPLLAMLDENNRKIYFKEKQKRIDKQKS